MHIGLRVVTATVLVAALQPAIAAGRVGPRMYSLTMNGFVGQPPQERREMADLRLRAAREDVRFQVTSARVLTGSMAPANVFNQVRPYRPNFILRGSKDQLRRVANAPRGAVLRISGRWRPGSQDLMVSSVERK